MLSRNGVTVTGSHYLVDQEAAKKVRAWAEAVAKSQKKQWHIIRAAELKIDRWTNKSYKREELKAGCTRLAQCYTGGYRKDSHIGFLTEVLQEHGTTPAAQNDLCDLLLEAARA